MEVVLLAVGRMKQGPERELLDRYVERAKGLARGVGIGGITTREIDESRARNPVERKREEARAVLAEATLPAKLIALDERGRGLSSQAFADMVRTHRDEAVSRLVVAVGGADGFADEVRARADACIGYGAATFPHQIVRLLAAEQIYRALTIMAGHPYHRA